MDLPLFRNDITNILEPQKPVIYSSNLQSALIKKSRIIVDPASSNIFFVIILMFLASAFYQVRFFCLYRTCVQGYTRYMRIDAFTYLNAYSFIKNWRFEVKSSSIDLESISSSNFTPIPRESTLTTLPLTVMSFSTLGSEKFNIIR